jgi:hypothetical protein
MPLSTQVDLAEQATNKNERRRNLRFPTIAMVEVVDLKSQAKISGRTNDLGLGGCYVDTLSPFPVGASVKLVIEREGKIFAAEGKVVYSQHGMGMGIAFTSATRGDVQLFQKWILELSGKAVVEPEAPETVQTKRAESGPNAAIHAVVSQLILMLMRKNLLSEPEAKELLKGLQP